MTDRERIRKSGTDEDEESAQVSIQGDTQEVDDLLDEIDSVLEENAEEFVRNYVQKGGE